MTEEVKNNILIATFLGWRKYEGFSFYTNHYQSYMSIGAGIQQTSIIHQEDLKFHKSFDWLIPVVKEIWSKDEYPIFVANTDGQFYEGGVILSTDINDLYKRVIEFVKWYIP